jgi:hypothetical protein
MLGFQLTANYWTPAYLPWAVPCVALALLFGTRREPIMQNAPP